MKTLKHQQTVIDFSTQSKNALLDRVRFRRGCGSNESTLKSIMRAIHRFAPVDGWCFVGLRRLAEQAGVSVSTVRRGIAILVGMGLVAEQRKPKSGPGIGFKFDYRWQVCWGAVQEYVNEFQAEQRREWLARSNEGEWLDSALVCLSNTQDGCQEELQEGGQEGGTEGDREESLARDGRKEAGPNGGLAVRQSITSAGEVDPVKQEVGAILRDTSVVDRARAAGAGDELIREVVAVYQANRARPENRWGPKALHYRLRELRAGQSAVEGWFKGNRVSAPEVMQAAEAVRSRERERRDEVSQRIQLIKYARSRGVSVERINEALEKRGWDLLPVFDRPVSCVGVG